MTDITKLTYPFLFFRYKLLMLEVEILYLFSIWKIRKTKSILRFVNIEVSKPIAFFILLLSFVRFFDCNVILLVHFMSLGAD